MKILVTGAAGFINGYLILTCWPTDMKSSALIIFQSTEG